MGTNYYTKINNCGHCGRFDEIHLGKSSFGWQFSFQYNGGKFYKNVPEMKEWLKDKEIKDEYGKVVSHKEFWDMVAIKQTAQNKNHALEAIKSDKSSYYEEVIDGYSFSNVEFS